MCIECFTDNIEKFESSMDFDLLDNALAMKLPHSMTMVKTNEIYRSVCFKIYKCNYCGENWCLSEPENAWRGFFCRERNVTDKIDAMIFGDNTKRGIGCIILIVLIIIIFMVFKH